MTVPQVSQPFSIGKMLGIIHSKIYFFFFFVVALCSPRTAYRMMIELLNMQFNIICRTDMAYEYIETFAELYYLYKPSKGAISEVYH